MNFVYLIVLGAIIAYCLRIAEKHHLNKYVAFFSAFFFSLIALIYYWYYDRSFSKKELKS